MGLAESAQAFKEVLNICADAEWLSIECSNHFDGAWSNHFDGAWNNQADPLFWKPAVMTTLALCSAKYSKSLEWWMVYHMPASDRSKRHYPNLDIKSSGIPNAGDGLFTTTARKKGDVICSFAGCWVAAATVKLNPSNNGYAFALDNEWPACLRDSLMYKTFQGSQANSINTIWHGGRQTGNQNVLFTLGPFQKPEHEQGNICHMSRGLVDVVAEDDIEAGAELLTDYGVDHAADAVEWTPGQACL